MSCCTSYSERSSKFDLEIWMRVCDKVVSHIALQGTEAIPVNALAILAGVRKQLQ